jgi:hypothetical protein
MPLLSIRHKSSSIHPWQQTLAPQSRKRARGYMKTQHHRRLIPQQLPQDTRGHRIRTSKTLLQRPFSNTSLYQVKRLPTQSLTQMPTAIQHWTAIIRHLILLRHISRRLPGQITARRLRLTLAPQHIFRVHPSIQQSITSPRLLMGTYIPSLNR